MDAYQTSDLRLFVGGDDWLADLSGFTGSVVASGDVEQQPLTSLDSTVVEQIALKLGHSISPGALYAGVETDKLRSQSTGILALVSLVPAACIVMEALHPGASIAASNETVVIHNTSFAQAGAHYAGPADAATVRVVEFTNGADVRPLAMAQGDTAFVVVTEGSGDFEFSPQLSVTASGPGVYSLGTTIFGIGAGELSVPAGASGYLLGATRGTLE